MKRRDFLRSASVAALASAGAVSCRSVRQVFEVPQWRAKPNVLFIAVDDLRPSLGCYGDLLAKTPNIDRLAAQGLTFLRAYCQQAVCAPSRSSLMTGLRPDSIGVWDLQTHFRKNRPDVVTLPQYFKERGYHARSIGKIYHDSKDMQDLFSWSEPELYDETTQRDAYLLAENRKGVNTSENAASVERIDAPDNAYVDGRVTDAAIDAMRELKDRPFFLAVGLRKPHLPFCAPAKYWDLYDRALLAEPTPAKVPLGAPGLALHDWTELRDYSDIPSKGPLSTEKIAELRHGYYAAVSYADANVGRLLDELDRLELARDTITVLWGDNGFHLGEQDLWGKTTNFELDTRVPLIVASRRHRERGAQTLALVELVDLYPTLIEICALGSAEGLEGSSFAPLFAHPARLWKKAAFSQFPRPFADEYKGGKRVMGRSIRTERYRYTEWTDSVTEKVVDRELYDLEMRADETVNIAEEPEQVATVQALSAQLREGWRAAQPPRAAGLYPWGASNIIPF